MIQSHARAHPHTRTPSSSARCLTTCALTHTHTQQVFGAYLPVGLKSQNTYYGTGQALIFSLHPSFRVFASKASNYLLRSSLALSLALSLSLWLSLSLRPPSFPSISPSSNRESPPLSLAAQLYVYESVCVCRTTVHACTFSRRASRAARL